MKITSRLPRKGLVILVLTLLFLSAVCSSYLFLNNPPSALAANGLTLTKAQGQNPLVGGQSSYSITIKNDGSNPNIVPAGYNLAVIDTLPPGMTWVSSSGTGLGTLPAPALSMAGGRQVLTWDNFKDLAVNESYTINIVAQLNPVVLVGTNLTNDAEASVNTDPRDTGTQYFAGGASVTGQALPFRLTKTTNQSTGVGQDNGACSGNGSGRQFYYKLLVENNYVGPSQNMVVTDTLPDGVAYCGTMITTGGGANIAPTVSGPNPATGVTTLTWNLGPMSTAQQIILQPQVVILYNYRGTDNGGPTALIPDGTTFTNQGSLTGTYLGNNYTSNSNSTVTGRYATIAKGSSVSTVATGDIVTYTLTPSTSTNYDASNMYIIDTVPNGQDVVLNSWSIAPSTGAADDTVFQPCLANANLVPSTTHGGVNSTPAPGVYLCNDGTSQISWGVFNDSAQTPMTAGQQFNITFQAQVRVTYRNASLPPVLAGDSFMNNVGMRFDADSIAALTPANQGNGGLTNRQRWENASAGQSTSLVVLNKNILGVTRGDGTATPTGEGRVTGSTGVVQGGAGSRSNNRTAVAAVGDIVTFQIEFNGSGSADMRNIVVRDFLPLTYAYIPGSTTYYNSAGTAYVDTVNTGAINTGTGTGPDAAFTAGPGNVLSWALTGIGGNNITPKNHIFRVQFKAQVVSGPGGFGNDNLAKVSGNDTVGNAYSDRDVVTVTTLAPNLTIAKSNNSASLYPTGIAGNQTFNYTVTIRNTGNSTAYRVANLVDSVPANIKYNSTVSTNPPGAATFVSYSPTGSGYGGTLTYSLTDLAPGATITLVYQAQVQPAPVVGTTDTNTVTIASYGSQPPAVTVNVTYPQIQATSNVLIGGQVLSKTATIHQPQVNGLGGLVTVGDRVDYTINFTLPGNATFPNGEIRECLPVGFHYIPGSYSTNNPVLPGPALPASPVVGAGTGPCAPNRDYVLINFGTQPNTGAAIPIVINLSASITGLDRNNVAVFDPVPGPTASNPNTVYLFAGTAQQGTPATSPSINIARPNLTLAKTRIRPATPSAGGVTVDFLLTLSNTGSSPAYDISALRDTLDSHLTYQQAYIVSSSTCDTSELIPANIVTGVTVAGQTVTIPVTSSLAAGGNYYVCVRTTLDTGVSPNTTYNNRATVGDGVAQNYYSAPASFTDRRAYTNADNPGASITTRNVTTTKAEISGNPSADGLAVPGEVVTYTLTFVIPQGTTLYNPVVRDNFDFSALGARLGLVSPANPSSGTLTCTGGTPPASGSYNFAVTGGRATFTFTGNLAAATDSDSTCVLNLQARELNIAANANGQPAISSDFTLNYVQSTGTHASSNSNTVNLAIQEPRVTVTKTLVTAYNAATGLVTFRIRVANSNAAGVSTAYDLSVTDNLPAGLVYVSNTAPTTGSGIINPAVGVVGNNLTLTVDSLAPGTSTSFDVVARGDGTLGAGQTINNIANLTYYDLPASINANNDQADPNSRRRYTGSSTLPITTAVPTFAKGPATQTINLLANVNFTLTLTVPAYTTLFNVVVNDTLPGGLVLQANGLSYGSATPVSCPAPGTVPADGNGPLSLGNIVNNTAQNCAYTVNVAARSDGTVPAVGASTATVINTGNFSYSQTSGGSTINVNRAANVTIHAPVLTLAKTNSPTGQVAVGNTIVYTLSYANTGLAPATGVVITDPVPAGTSVVGGSITGGGTQSGGNIVWNLGTVNAGASGSVSFSVTVDSLPGSGSVVNTATLTSTELPDVSDTASNSNTNLQAAKSVSPTGAVNPGATLTYSIVISNPTPATAPATGIVVTDQVPANTTLVGGSITGGGTASGSTITWNIASLAAGATATLSFQVTVNLPLVNGTTIVNHAAYHSGQQPSSSDTNQVSTPVNSAPVLALVKVQDPNGALGANGTVTYTLTLSNTGNENALNAVISDTIPAGTSFASASPGGSYNSGTNQVSWNVGAVAAPSGSATVSFTVSVDPAPSGQVPAGLNVVNRASYSYNNGPGGNSGSGQSNQTTDPTLSHAISKSAAPVTGSTVTPGSIITYSLTYTNTGTGNFTGVTVTDTVPVNTSYINGSANLGGSLVGNVVTWNLGPVNAGQVVSLSFQVRVNIPTANGSDIANVAGASGSGTASGTVPDITSNITHHTVTSAPILAVLKANTPSTPVRSGDVINYSLEVSNTGDEDATNVVVVDDIPTGTTYVAGTATGPGPVTFSNNRLSFAIPSLPISTSATLHFQVTVNAALPVNAAGRPVDIVNNGRIVSSTQTGPLSNPIVSNQVNNPTVGLQISKSNSPSNGQVVYYGHGIVYTIQYLNTGSLTLTGVQVRDDIPAGVVFVSSSNGGVVTAGGANNRGYVTWNIGSLAAGQSGSVTLVVEVDKPTNPANLTIFNNAQIQSNELPAVIVSNQVNNRTEQEPPNPPPATPTPTPTPTVTPTPTGGDTPDPSATPVPGTPTPAPVMLDPVIVKTVDNRIAAPGQKVRFTITVSNPGSIPLTSAKVTDDVPAIFRLNGVTSSQGTITIQGQKVTVDIGVLAPGVTVVIVVDTVIKENAEQRQYSNIAVLQGLQDGKPIGKTDGSSVDLSGLSSGTDVALPGLPNTGQGGAAAGGDGWPVPSLLVLVALVLVSRRWIKKSNLKKVGQKISLLVAVLVALTLLNQTLVQAGEEDWTRTSSIRTDATDWQMFGKSISTTRFSAASNGELKPSNGPVVPARLRIPSLGIDTAIEQLGLTTGGQMDVPGNIWNAGWFKPGAMPGEVGNALIAGHKDSVRGTAVFWYLDRLQKGDRVYVSDAGGNELTFEVMEVSNYRTSEAPLDRLFGSSSEANLNLLSCTGTFLPNQHTYDQRVVAYTRLVS